MLANDATFEIWKQKSLGGMWNDIRFPSTFFSNTYTFKAFIGLLMVYKKNYLLKSFINPFLLTIYICAWWFLRMEMM